MPFTSLYNNPRSVYGKPPVRSFCQASLDEVAKRYGNAGLKTLERMLQERLRPVDAALDDVANDVTPGLRRPA